MSKNAAASPQKIHLTGCESVYSVPNLTGDYGRDVATEIARREAALKADQERAMAYKGFPSRDLGAGLADQWRYERECIEQLRATIT